MTEEMTSDEDMAQARAVFCQAVTAATAAYDRAATPDFLRTIAKERTKDRSDGEQMTGSVGDGTQEASDKETAT